MAQENDMLDYLLSNPDRILSMATGAVTIASIITAHTDTPEPDSFLGKVYKILEVLALVYGKAKQK